MNHSNEEPEVRGVALDQDQAQLTVTNIPDKPGSAAAICRALAEHGISLDTIVQSERERSTSHGPCRDIAFTLPKDDRDKAQTALKQLLKQWEGAEIQEGPSICRVSAVGAGMPTTAGTAAKCSEFADAGVNIEMIATSEIRISCVVKEEKASSHLEQYMGNSTLAANEEKSVKQHSTRQLSEILTSKIEIDTFWLELSVTGPRNNFRVSRTKTSMLLG